MFHLFQNLFRVKIAKPPPETVKPKLLNETLARPLSTISPLLTHAKSSFNLPKGIIISSVTNTHKKDLNTNSAPTTIVMNAPHSPASDVVHIQSQQLLKHPTITPLKGRHRSAGVQFLKTYTNSGKSLVKALPISPNAIVSIGAPIENVNAVVEMQQKVEEFDIIEEESQPSPMVECEEEEYLLDEEEIEKMHVDEAEDNDQVTYADVLQHEKIHLGSSKKKINTENVTDLVRAIKNKKVDADDTIIAVDVDNGKLLEQEKTLVYDKKVEVLKPASMINVQISNGILSDPNGPIKMLVQGPADATPIRNSKKQVC